VSLTGLNSLAMVLEFAQGIPDLSVRSIKKDRPTLDESEFRAFYEETSRPLFAYLLRVCRERAIAVELLQESFCRLLYAKRPPHGAHRRKYLFRIATNLMRDRWRRIKSNPEDAWSDSPTDVAASSDDHDLSIDMRQALQQLKGRERQLLWLAYVEGSNHREIAEVTGLKESSIRLLLFRARRRLAGIIGERTQQSAPEVEE
jgi:RNA polymerase sigma-70 factor (ECF subfamily)